MNLLKRLTLGLLLALAITTAPALATVTANSVITAQTPNRGIVQFLQGTDSAGTYKTLYTSGANGSKCNAMWSTNDDGSATHLVTVQIVNGGIKFGGMAITTTSSQGFANAVPAINLMSSANWPGLALDSDGNPFIMLITGDTIQATYATALTASTRINIVATCVDF